MQVGRALAAYLVVLVHTRGILAMAGASARWSDFGNAGVDIFFVISGFIMAYVTAAKPTTAGSFLKARVLRVVPLYWIMTVAVAIAATIVPPLFDHTKARADWVLKSLFFVPFLRRDGTLQPIVFVGWTLDYEMFFYVVFAAALLLRKRSWTITAAVAMLAMLVAIGTFHHQTGVFATFYTDLILIEFLFGVLIAEALPLLPRRVPRPLIFAALALMPLSLGTMAALASRWNKLHRALIYGVPAVVFVAAIVALERWGWRVPRGMLTKLGDASYAVYLTHPFVVKPVTMLAGKLHAGAALAITLELAAFAVIAVVGRLVYDRLELPVDRLLRKWTTRPIAVAGVATT